MGQRWLFLGSLLLTWAKVSGGEPPAGAHIPPVHGVTLTGERVDLPEAFQGKVGVLVVGFSLASRGDVTAWGKRLASDYRDPKGVTYYEMPMLASVPRLLRGWVLKKIAAEIPQPAQGRFLPLYDDEPEWRAAAGYTKPDDAYVLVVDGAGVVQFHAQGQATETTYAEVRKRVDGLR